jgi:hypothetical protein
MTEIVQLVDYNPAGLRVTAADDRLRMQAFLSLVHHRARPLSQPVFDDLSGSEQERFSPGAAAHGLATRRLRLMVELP